MIRQLDLGWLHLGACADLCEIGHERFLLYCPPLQHSVARKQKWREPPISTVFAKDPLGGVTRQIDKPGQSLAETPEGGVVVLGGEKALVRWAPTKSGETAPVTVVDGSQTIHSLSALARSAQYQPGTTIDPNISS